MLGRLLVCTSRAWIYQKLHIHSAGDGLQVLLLAHTPAESQLYNSNLAVQSCEYRGLLANQRPGIRMKKNDWVYWAIWMNEWLNDWDNWLSKQARIHGGWNTHPSAVTRMLQIRGGKIDVIHSWGGEYWKMIGCRVSYRYSIRFDTMHIPIFLAVLFLFPLILIFVGETTWHSTCNPFILLYE